MQEKILKIINFLHHVFIFLKIFWPISGVAKILGNKADSTNKYLSPYKNITQTIENQLQPLFSPGWNQGGSLETYLSNTYKTHKVVVVFGLMDKTNCIGYVDAGFRIPCKKSK